MMARSDGPAIRPRSSNGRQAGTRTSPIDGRTLSRSFPGDVLGTPTSIIADYVERHLMAASDIVIDLHSDGRSLRYLPSVTMIHHTDSEVRQRRMAVALAFGAPNLVVFHSFEDRNTSGAARRAGSVRVGTEIGGTDPVRMAVDGVLRVLHWAGIVEGATPAPTASRKLVVRQDSEFVYALNDGLFEPACHLGDEVSEGDLAGHIHDAIEAPSFAPGSVVAKAALEALVRCFAFQLAASGTTVNAVVPGYTRKDAGKAGALSADAWVQAAQRTPTGRLNEADEVAAAIQFLLSAEARQITGALLPIDGGLTIG